MFGRTARLGIWAGLILLLSASTAVAQVASLSLHSVDRLLDAVRYSLTMAGQEEQARQLDSLLEAFLQKDGLKGLDTKKVLGAYLPQFPVNPSKPAFVMAVPISTEKEFLDLLGRLNVTVANEKEGFRGLEAPTGQKGMMRFHQGYAFIAEGQEQLRHLPAADAWPPTLPENTLLQLTIHLDQIPAPLKKLILAGMDAHLAQSQAKNPDESPEEHHGRLMGMKLARGFITRIVEDTQAFQVSLTLDQGAHRAALEAQLTAKTGSPLHEEIQQMTQSKTSFAGLLDSAAASFVSHGTLNESLRSEFNQLIDNAIQAGLSKEKSVVKRALAEKVFKVLEPTLKASVYDTALALRGGQEGKPMTGLLAVRVKNGKEIEALVRDLVEEVKGKERELIHLDADKVGDLSLHVFNAPVSDEKGREAAEVFGAIQFTFAFQQDALLVALGKNGVAEIKRAVEKLREAAAAQPASVQLDFHARPFARFEKDPQKRQVVESTLTAPGSDLIRVTLRGGDQLRFQMQVSTHFLKLAKAMSETRQGDE